MRILILFMLLLAIPVSIHAQDLFPEELIPTVALDPEHVLKGGEYQLELSPLEEEQQTTPKLIDTLSAPDRKQFTNHGYILRQTEGEMTLSLSSGRVGLGSVSGAGTHTAPVEIAVSATTPTGYGVLAAQETTGEAEHTWSFQPTTCDDSRKPCTPLKAGPWKSDTTYGFGYTLSGPDTPLDFKNSDYFRPLRAQFPVMIAGNEKIDGMRSLVMSYKLNAPPSTEEGVYSTNVSIVVVSK